MSTQLSMFSQPAGLAPIPKNWRPDPLPELDDRHKVIALDVETTGKDKWKDKPVGIAISLQDNRDFYTGGHDQNVVRNWLQSEIRNKIIVNLNTGFDAEQLRNDGVDLELGSNRLVDIAHHAALLNEYRFGGFGLDSIGKEFVGRGKVECPVNAKDIHRAHPSLVSEYAKGDSRLALDVYNAQLPLLEKEGLMEVALLESDLIYVVNEMERNGSYIDLPKLERWRRELRQEVETRTINLFNMTGVRVNPNSHQDMRKLFARLGIPYVDLQMETLKRISHPAIREALCIKQILSLLSKYLDTLHTLASRTGFVRYTLHQLRADEGGTVTGRFSSSGGKDRHGINCQQVMKPEKQRRRQAFEGYIIRELFIPRAGAEWFSSDAKQIEFRLFGHYAQNKKMLVGYEKNPNMDFYAFVVDLLKEVAGYTITRENSKVLNLASIYGQGKDKRQKMLGVDEETREIIDSAYNTAFPEASRLLRQAAKLGESRGWVKTFIGRRGRFDKEHDRYHSALNKVIQGTAADIMKKKLLRIYRMRKELEIVLRMTVHDEADGDLLNPDKKDKLQEVLDYQEIPTRVPILWDTGYGPNWAAAGE